MASESVTYTISIHNEGAGGYWAEVAELPGCFASGDDLDELYESLREAIGLYLSHDDHVVEARFGFEDGPSTEQRTVQLCDA